MTCPAATLQHVCSNEHAAVFERCFENRRYLRISDQLASDANSIIQVFMISSDQHTPKKRLLCHQTNLVSLFHDGFGSRGRTTRQFRLMHLKVQTLKALNSCNEFGLRDSHSVLFLRLSCDLRLCFRANLVWHVSCELNGIRFVLRPAAPRCPEYNPLSHRTCNEPFLRANANRGLAADSRRKRQGRRAWERALSRS